MVAEAKAKYGKPGGNQELALLPQTPGNKKGRRKRTSQAAAQGEPSSKKPFSRELNDTATTSTRASTRTGRAASKVCSL